MGDVWDAQDSSKQLEEPQNYAQRKDRLKKELGKRTLGRVAIEDLPVFLKLFTTHTEALTEQELRALERYLPKKPRK